jgi:hypothetical protein
MTAILHDADLIRFAAMAAFLTVTLLVGRLVTCLAPARRHPCRPPTLQRRANPTVLS